jgi:short-subunit dehydrogenase
MELAPDNIRVGLMLPGITATGLFPECYSHDQRPTSQQRSMAADTPEHVAEKIVEAVECEAAEVYAPTA